MSAETSEGFERFEFEIQYTDSAGQKERVAFEPLPDSQSGTHRRYEWFHDEWRGWQPRGSEVVSLVATAGGDLPEPDPESGSKSGVDR